jgi:hypothetical protein
MKHRSLRNLLVGIASALALLWAIAGAKPAAPPSLAGTSHALILVGLPGDDEHDKLFATIAGQWRTWLTGSLGFAPDDVQVLFGRAGKTGLAKGDARRASIESTVSALKKSLRREDRLWVFLLGHGNYDGEHAYFHLPGPDLRDDQLGKLFGGIASREQLFWVTTSASGWFLRSLSAKGRIVITATAADEEFNETEFPEALADVIRLPVERLDDNKDGKVSVLELYRHTVAEVEARFARDRRLPTEHAQLDDNGDGVGAEAPIVTGEKGKKPTADGKLAERTFLPYRVKERK